MSNPDVTEHLMPEETPSAAIPATPLAATSGAKPPEAASATGPATGRSMTLASLQAYYSATHAVKDVNLHYAPNQVTAMIGPSGCGKSTVLRCLNRMHEEIPGARAEGRVTLDDIAST